jgi:hypothetical protein
MKTDQFLLIAFVLLAGWLLIMISNRRKEGVDETLSSSTGSTMMDSSSMSTGSTMDSTAMVTDTSSSGGTVTTGTGGQYAPADHNHDDKYAKIENDKYAKIDHDHDSKYARADHTHDDLTGRINTLETGEKNVLDRIGIIEKELSGAKTQLTEGEKQVRNAVYNIQSVT